MITTIVVLYLSVVTETKDNVDITFFPVNKYSSYRQCEGHKKIIDKKQVKYIQPKNKTKLYFCSSIPYTDAHSYIDEIPQCSKYIKNKYFCGYPI
jgi:hypothetical protein